MIKQYPFYLKSTVVLFGLILLTYTLFNLREILVPLAFGILLAVLLNSLTNKFQQKKIPHVLSIILSMLIAFILIAGIIFFISSQLAKFSTELPTLKHKFEILFQQLQQQIVSVSGMTIEKQNEMLSNAKSDLKPMAGYAVGSAIGTLGTIVLLPVYTFLFLYYKKLMLNFLYEVFSDNSSKEVKTVLEQTNGAIQSYMGGLLLEALIVAAMNSIALLLLGVKYAILLGVIGALLNMLPYIGGIIAIALPVIIATITKDGFNTQLGVIIAYIIIQFIDNHFIIPAVVSSKVKINALISIVIVLLGGALWGVAGMFLSIPFIGILKIIFDRIPELKPWGKLLGDEVPTKHRGEKIRSRKAKT